MGELGDKWLSNRVSYHQMIRESSLYETLSSSRALSFVCNQLDAVFKTGRLDHHSRVFVMFFTQWNSSLSLIGFFLDARRSLWTFL